MTNYNFVARKANRHLLLFYLPNVSIEKDYVLLHLLPACSYKPLTKTIISWVFFPSRYTVEKYLGKLGTVG